MKSFSELIQSEKPVLVDFFAEWCEPCKTMAPILSNVKSKLGEGATIIKIDVDKNPQAAAAYQVRGVPTLRLFKKGNIVWQQSGVVAEKELLQILQANS